MDRKTSETKAKCESITRQECFLLARSALSAGVILLLAAVASAQKPPLLPETQVAALANELSGETAKRNLEVITTYHRQRGSRGFHAAAELVADRLRSYGLSDARILEFPADGKIFYGTQRSRPAWEADSAELVEIQRSEPPEKIPCGGGASAGTCLKTVEHLLASYAAMPVVLAEDSESADVTADLVDVGNGTQESDYTGKDVKGKIVLTAAQPGAVQNLAVGKFGAAGIVSYAQNQHTAWWGEDENLIRWGHLQTFSANKTFGFMVSLKTARALQARLARGETIQLHAVVKAGQRPGNYEVVTATIPGADSKLKEEEIAFSCHLDHQRPGANDNASGCVTILEVARTLQKLIAERKLPRPARTIRFNFPPEIEGTLALLNGHPELAGRIKAAIHMDMVGGGPATKAVFHVTRGPMSLPSFVHDVAWSFAEWVNQESYKFAATGAADFPLVAPEGGKEPLRAEYSAFTMGSDHEVYQDSSFGIPAIYLNDWPDRYIHTNFDTAANIDPTKLKRAAFIGAASGYVLANLNQPGSRERIGAVISLGRAYREAQSQPYFLALLGSDRHRACEFMRIRSQFEQAIQSTADPLPTNVPTATFLRKRYEDFVCATAQAGGAPSQDNEPKFRRRADPKGPLSVFGYDYFAVHAKTLGITTPKLLGYEGLWGSGEEYAYEVLNFVDGKRNVQEICDAVSAEYGPVPLDMVIEYLDDLEKIGLVEKTH